LDRVSINFVPFFCALCVSRILQAKIKLTNKTILKSYTFTQVQKKL